MRLYSGTDLFGYPIVIGDDEVIDFQWDINTHQIEIPAGEYYLTGAIPGLDSWLELLDDIISDAVGANVFTQFATPLGGRDFWGLMLDTPAPPSEGWGISSASEDLMPYLGMVPGHGPDTMLTTTDSVTSPYSIRGAWRSPVVPVRKFRDEDVIQTDSGAVASRRDVTRWIQNDFRTFDYRDIPAVHIRRGRHEYPKYCEVGGLADGDANNSLWHLVDALGRGSEIFVFHNMATVDTAPDVDGYEVGRCVAGDAPVLSDLIEESPRQAEFYAVKFTMEIISSTYVQD